MATSESLHSQNGSVKTNKVASRNTSSPRVDPEGKLQGNEIIQVVVPEDGDAERRSENLETSNERRNASTEENVPLLEGNAAEWERKGACFEREINNLVELEDDEVVNDTSEKRRRRLVLRKALEESRNNVKNLEEKVMQRNKQIESLKFEIYQLVGFFFLFAGVVFTAVTSPNRLERQHLWSPLALCLFAYVVVGCLTYYKFKSVGILENDNHIEKQASRTARKVIDDLKIKGLHRFEFSKDYGHPFKPRHTSLIVTAIVLTVFTFMLLGSFVHIILIKAPNCGG